MRMTTRRRRQRGFTLVELMVSLVIFSFAVVGLLAVGVSMTNGFREQRDAVTAESLVRLPIDYITDAIRQASPAVPGFNIADADSCSTSALSITNSNAAPDTLDVIYASGGVVTAMKTALTTGLSAFDVIDPTGLAGGDYIVVSNIAQGHFFKIVSVLGNTITIQHNCGTYALPVGGYAAGSFVVRAIHATFSVGAVDGVSTLMMDPDGGGAAVAEPLAEGIEDMQVAVGIDSGADGLQEVGALAGDDDWVFNKTGESVAVWPPASPAVIRAVRITLIARSANQDVGNTGSYTRPGSEDRPAAAAADNFRRRVLKSRIEFRNVGASP